MSVFRAVKETASNSKQDRSSRWRGGTEYSHWGEMRRPVPPPLPEGHGMWENEDTNLVSKSSKKEHDLYTSIVSDQSYSFQQEALYFCGNLKLEKDKTLASPFGVQIPSLESHDMLSSDLTIKMIPESSIDVARNLLETERMQAYNYMDISNREDTFVEQYLPLENWGEGGVTDTESHLEKKHVGIVEPLHLMLASQTYLTHKHPASSVDKSDHQAYQALGTLHTTNPMCNTIREPPTPGNGSSPEYHPPIISERESILSLGVMGIPTVSLSEYVDDNPDSPIGTTESAASRVTVSTPTLTASEDATSADSGDSKIKLVSPPDCKKPTNTTSISSVPAGATTSVQPTPPIQYSILREEREAELDSELVNESFDENPEKEHAALTLPPRSFLTTSATSARVMDESPSESPASASSTEGVSEGLRRSSKYSFHRWRTSSVEVSSAPFLSLASISLERPWNCTLVFCPLPFSCRSAILAGCKEDSTPVEQHAALLFLPCLAILSTTVSFRIYKSVLQAVQKTDEGPLSGESYLEIDMTLSQEQMQKYAEGAQYYISCILKELCRLFLVQDLVDSLKFSVLMWLLTYVGTLFNGLTLLIMGEKLQKLCMLVYTHAAVSVSQSLGGARGCEFDPHSVCVKFACSPCL
uniref:Reticulon n=1 Tax=Scleropages formosus TaxID=113540 RepID=A0A8D0CG27_SCLFO